METIFWCINCIIALILELLVLYFYLTHDDMQRGKLNGIEFTNSLKTLMNIEFVLQLVITFDCLFN